MRIFQQFSQILFMPNRSTSGENNRANEGNQSSRHRQSRGKVLDKKLISNKRSQINLNLSEQAHEYYPQFDHTGTRINPSKPVKRH
jgi:hypothetical protein